MTRTSFAVAAAGLSVLGAGPVAGQVPVHRSAAAAFGFALLAAGLEMIEPLFMPAPRAIAHPNLLAV